MTALDWGVRASFMRYVSAVPDGVVDIGGGVETIGGGLFRFPAADEPPSDGEPQHFSGVIRFTAHYGMLNLTIADPWLTQTGDDRFLSVRANLESAERTEIAALTEIPSESAGTTRRFRAEMTIDGAALFGDMYSEGTELDDVVVTA